MRKLNVMGNLIKKVFRILAIFIINTFLCTTRFFSLKRFLLNISGIQIGKDTKVVGPIHIGTVAQVVIGEDCWIGSGFKVYGNGIVIIGDKCDFGPDVAFVTGSHEIGTAERRAGAGISFSLSVESGCWIGARVTIVGNTTVGRSSIIGATSLVNKDIASNVIALGSPAKEFKKLEV
ncbi:maltose O-acetyltransferase [Chryseobacterium daecheongense]|uniref:Maltose O-acetyltransferase n=1 Tax=Chryseobacterium daecheongense TaxID=192389 RepID=A0ABY2FYE6_9FLAO|nr:maltose O-acetyltransferase [Chryseobacterium daecheongense]